MTRPEVLFAVPSKGELHAPTLRFLEMCGARVNGGQAREYTARVQGHPNAGVQFLRADEIPGRVEAGELHFGITGEDLYREYTEDESRTRLVLPELGFGHARLVLAVPRSWLDVTAAADLEEVASQFRNQHRRPLRVATKFPRLTRAFFGAHGITDYTIVSSAGATEGAPAAGTADVITDITSTGATLAQNHLKEIEGGTLLRSQACLVASARPELWTAPALRLLEQIVDMAAAHERARAGTVLRFTVPAAQTAAVLGALHERFGCGVQDGIGATMHDAPGTPPAGAWERTAVCPDEQLFAAVQYLRGAGCAHITCARADYVFGAPSPRLAAFRASLRGA